jgi:hypothetical protein
MKKITKQTAHLCISIVGRFFERNQNGKLMKDRNGEPERGE